MDSEVQTEKKQALQRGDSDERCSKPIRVVAPNNGRAQQQQVWKSVCPSHRTDWACSAAACSSVIVFKLIGRTQQQQDWKSVRHRAGRAQQQKGCQWKFPRLSRCAGPGRVQQQQARKSDHRAGPERGRGRGGEGFLLKKYGWRARKRAISKSLSSQPESQGPESSVRLIKWILPLLLACSR
jgi:hypothetical protein